MIYVYLVVALFFALLFTREVIAPASMAQCDRRWQILATTLNAVQAMAALAVGIALERVISSTSLLHLKDDVHFVIGGSLTFLLASFIAYWWHRATHESDFLWRHIHQLHHSPQRIEVHTAFFAHPLDTAIATAISCLTGYVILGVDYRAVAFELLLVSLFTLYIHSDTKSPRWLGYFVQRPEMHRVHHKRDHHADNYGLPLWDMLFGTWMNPASYVEHCGFESEKSGQIADMLLGKDVHR